jgi:hypothetical protein
MGGGSIRPFAPDLDVRRWSDPTLRIMPRGQQLKLLLEFKFLAMNNLPAPCGARGLSVAYAVLDAELQRLDFHLAELHHALVIDDAFVVLEAQSVLQGNPTARELGVLRGIDGFLPIEDHGEG